MDEKRNHRLASQLVREVSDIILRKISDPRLNWVTITHAEVSGDFKEAKLFVRTLEKGEKEIAMLAGLEHAAGFIRHELGNRLTWRAIPELSFIKDDQSDKVENVLRIISDLKQGGNNSHGGTETGA